jgi:hypothetical protein
MSAELAGKDCRKKEVALPLRRATAQPRFPLESPKRLRGWQPHMYTRRSPYLYPGACASGGYLRSVRTSLSASLSQPRRARHLLVFVLVALPPPPVYVLDNEARPKSSGVATRRLIKSSRAPSRFYPRGPKEVCRPSLCAKPFGFSVRRHGSRLNRLLLSSNGVSPHPFADPLAGHDSLENRDGRRTISTCPERVKRFFENFFKAIFIEFSAFSPHAKT